VDLSDSANIGELEQQIARAVWRPALWPWSGWGRAQRSGRRIRGWRDSFLPTSTTACSSLLRPAIDVAPCECAARYLQVLAL